MIDTLFERGVCCHALCQDSTQKTVPLFFLHLGALLRLRVVILRAKNRDQVRTGIVFELLNKKHLSLM